MPRYAYRRDPQFGIVDLRFVAPDYVIAQDEEEGEGDELPVQPLPKITPPVSATIDDIVAVMTADQQAALQARLDARKTAPSVVSPRTRPS